MVGFFSPLQKALLANKEIHVSFLAPLRGGRRFRPVCKSFRVPD